MVRKEALPFVDVPGHWAEGDVEWCWRRELMNGVSPTLFAPDITMTRAMFVTILGRVEGVDAVWWSGAASFADVEQGSWYAPYAAWAKSTGLIMGRDEHRFAPADPITRQELAVLLRRYMVWRGMSLEGQETHAFTDAAAIPSWASQAVDEVSRAGLLIGYPDGSFGPQQPLTRAQSATLLHRLAARRYPTGNFR